MTASQPRPTNPLRLATALVVATAATFALAACTPGSPTPGASSPTSVSSDPSDAASGSSEPTDSATDGSTDAAYEEMSANLADAISSGNTAAVEGYLTDPVRVLIAASEADGQYSPVDAVLSLDYVQPGVGSWDFALAPEVIAAYAGSPYYGSFFPANVIAGRSSTGSPLAFV